MKKKTAILGHVSVLLALASLLVGCNIDDAARIDLVELGATQKSFTVSEEAGTLEISVLSNGAYHVEQLDEANWIAFDRMTGEGDGTLNVSYTMNEEFKRMTRFVLCSDVDNRRDTLSLKQQGTISAILTKDNTSLIAPGKGGDLVETIKTNVPFSYMTVRTTFPEGADTTWISGIRINDSGSENMHDLTITTAPNPDSSNPRTASIDFSFTDGWGEQVGITLNLVQRNAQEGLGRLITFREFIDTYSTGKPISEYIILEGRVVSNTELGNAGENEQTTTSAIDYTGSQRTVYLQNEDASLGIMLLTQTAADNIFNQFDKVQVLLYGTTATLYSDPDRVNVKGVTSGMVVSRVAGTKSDIPLKEKTIGELSDADMYTYVTLKDVELPVRKGAILPVNEGYAIGTSAHRISKYPLMVRDRNADHLYMYTNTVCLYRNDGTRLPYGSGKISGVIVHERFSRFEWRDGADPLEIEDDVTLGNIGRYQIRHQNKEDIWGQMNDSVENSFSALLTEYRYWYPDKENEVCLPTYGTNGWFTHTYQRKYTGSEAKEYTQATYKQHMWGAGTYEYLGPIGTVANGMFGNHWGNINGLGIVIDPAKEYFNTTDAGLTSLLSYNPDGTIEWCGPYATSKDAVNNSAQGAGGINNQSSSMYGKGNAYGACFTGWASHYWWDYDTNRPYGWMLNFSTEGIVTDHISLQISVMNAQQNWYAPRYWKAEWSFVDSMAAKDDNQWHLIGEYTVPDVSVWSNTLYSSIVGFKTLDWELPQEILGQPNVYVRLVPTSDLCSDGADYANARLRDQPAGEAAHASAIEYIAIRYNK